MEVTHRPDQKRFVVESPQGEAELVYEKAAGSVTFTHTFVPPGLRGQGLAEKLMQVGVTWARAEGLTPQATCSYAAAYLARNVA